MYFQKLIIILFVSSIFFACGGDDENNPVTAIDTKPQPEKTLVEPVTAESDQPTDTRTEIKKKLEKEMGGNVKVTNVPNFNVDSLKKTLPGADLPKMNDKEKQEMWDHTVHKQMRMVLNILCKQYKAGRLEKDKKLIEHESGIKIMPVAIGPGKEVKDDSFVALKFVAMTVEGEVEYDHMFMKDRFFRFKMGKGEVIPGLEAGIKTMRAGGKAFFFIPAKLAYGDKGRVGVPPNSEVAYLVALDQVN